MARGPYHCSACGRADHNVQRCDKNPKCPAAPPVDPGTPLEWDEPAAAPVKAPRAAAAPPAQVGASRGRLTSAVGAGDDPLACYFGDIQGVTLLTREQEVQIATEYRRTGDPALRDRLVLGYVRLVVKIARSMRRTGVYFEDLIQEGNIGLMRAVETFDPTRGIRLGTFATWWIMHFMRRHVEDAGSTIRVPVHRRNDLAAVRKARTQLSRSGESPDNEQLARATGLPATTVEAALTSADIMRGPVSLEEPDRLGNPVQDSIPDHPASRPDAVAEAIDLRSQLRYKLASFARSLDHKRLVVLRDRLLADDPDTLEEIGGRLGVTRERVRQIEQRLLSDLRDWLVDQMDVESLVA